MGARMALYDRMGNDDLAHDGRSRPGHEEPALASVDGLRRL